MLPDYLLFVVGLILLLGSADLLVRNAVKLAGYFGRSSMFIGLTVAAFGTSAPELAVGISGLMRGTADVGLGNIVGSNIFNILFVLGLAALIRPVLITRPTIRRDVPILLATCTLFFLFARDGFINTAESLALLLILVGYLIYVSRRPGDLEAVPALESDRLRAPVTGRQLAISLSLTLVSIVLLMVASRWMVAGAVSLAAGFGMSEFVIGLTIVAVGTSLPEIATTLAAIRRHEHELAVGNVLGSCLFNVVAIPATMALLHTSALPVASEAISVDIPVMLLTVVACLPIFVSSHRISRSEGLLFLVYYLVYALLLYFRSSSDSILSNYKTELAIVGFPILITTIVILSIRALGNRPQPNDGDRQ
ncbi:MAG: calcium/sodium antiporter [candidate division Zixibacteria bacterium]|nr:calcium/sodium antiporter [candidate division Zixibacteria bacterium]